MRRKNDSCIFFFVKQIGKIAKYKPGSLPEAVDCRAHMCTNANTHRQTHTRAQNLQCEKKKDLTTQRNQTKKWIKTFSCDLLKSFTLSTAFDKRMRNIIVWMPRKANGSAEDEDEKKTSGLIFLMMENMCSLKMNEVVCRNAFDQYQKKTSSSEREKQNRNSRNRTAKGENYYSSAFFGSHSTRKYLLIDANKMKMQTQEYPREIEIPKSSIEANSKGQNGFSVLILHSIQFYCLLFALRMTEFSRIELRQLKTKKNWKKTGNL